MSILVLPTSLFVEAQLAELRRLAPQESIVTDADAADPGEVEVILAFRLPQDIVKRFPRLRFVASAGAGVDELLAGTNVPAPLPVTRPRDLLQAARMAQYLALVVLRWHRELPRYEIQQREHRWTRHLAQDERGWTVGLMGFGTLGSAAATTLKSLGYPVCAWTRTPHDAAGIDFHVGSDELPAFLARTRVLACLLPLTVATRGLLDARTLAQLPEGAYVINVSRGAIVVEDDLIAALDAGHLAGAALDVHAHEPLPAGNAIWQHDRILVTPHIAASPRAETAARQLLDNLARARRGEPLLHLVDRDRGY